MIPLINLAKIREFLSILATLTAMTGPAFAAELTSRPSGETGPTEIEIRVIFLDLENVSGADQNFTANIAYAARWTDERLRHAGPGVTTVPLDEIWHPRIQILNRQSLQETLPDEAQVSPEGEVVTIQRVWGQLSQSLLLHDFPFDRQTLRFVLVGAGHEEGTVVFASDTKEKSAVSDALSISDWEVRHWDTEPFELSIANVTKKIPAFRFSLSVKRSHGYHVVNVMLPLVMIICMSWVVFWIDPKNIAPRISVSITAMLTLIAYRFAVGASLPKIAYLTRMDWFILGSSFLVFTSLLEVVVTSYYTENDQPETGMKINQRMRIIAPAAFVVIALVSLTG